MEKLTNEQSELLIYALNRHAVSVRIACEKLDFTGALARYWINQLWMLGLITETGERRKGSKLYRLSASGKQAAMSTHANLYVGS